VATFLDTNVAVYAHDQGAGNKRVRALEILADPAIELVVSTQVLAEFYWATTRKLRPALSPADATKATRLLAGLPVVRTDRDLVLAAITSAAQFKLSLWDALIIEAAASAGCEVLLTEDLSHGQTVRGVRIVNPFS
jgi:predicted nucleic acid-binding protein